MGKQHAQKVPRGVHGEWLAPSGRRDPVEMLEEQGATRVPELVPIRYGRMLVSPFTFYRAAAGLMAADLEERVAAAARAAAGAGAEREFAIFLRDDEGRSLPASEAPSALGAASCRPCGSMSR